MADRIEIGWLFDFYGPLLTERQRNLLALYCNEDFSLSEIAAREGISRQGVYDAVHRAARQLEDYERQLGLLKRYQSMTQGLEEGLSALESGQTQRAKEILERLRGMDVKERMARFDLKPDRADVIVPAGEIFVNVAGALHSDYVLVPALGLADGIVERLYMEFNSWK